MKAKHVRALLQLPVPLADTDANTDATLRYAAIDKALLPTAESLKTTADRVLPYWENEIVPQIKSGKKLLIAAHGNSLRALVMHLDGISEEDITELNIPTAIPLVYELDDDMKPIPHPDGIGPVSGEQNSPPIIVVLILIVPNPRANLILYRPRPAPVNILSLHLRPSREVCWQPGCHPRSYRGRQKPDQIGDQLDHSPSVPNVHMTECITATYDTGVASFAQVTSFDGTASTLSPYPCPQWTGGARECQASRGLACGREHEPARIAAGACAACVSPCSSLAFFLFFLSVLES